MVTPAVRAGELFLAMTRGSEAAVKSAVFELRTALTEVQLGEAFIEAGGVPALLDVAEDGARPALQTYALQAMRSVLAYDVGAERALAARGATRLVSLMHGQNIRGACAALELLFLLASRPDGFTLIHGAVLSVAKARAIAAAARARRRAIAAAAQPPRSRRVAAAWPPRSRRTAAA